MEDRWAEVERLVEEFYREVERRAAARALGERTNLFFEAVAGVRGRANARLERITVTVLGDFAPRFFKPFFAAVEELEEPFDFSGLLLRDNRLYAVKVVSGDATLNSTMRRAVEEASGRHENPVILTLQGEYFEERRVGRARWLSAPASWSMVAGSGAYNRFRSIVYEVARRHRAQILSALLAAIEERSSPRPRAAGEA